MAVAVAVVKALAPHAAMAQHVHRATAPLHHAEMGLRAHKEAHALKARATLAVKAAAKEDVARSRVAMYVLTNGATAKAAPHRVAHVRKVVAKAVALTVADKAVAKSVASTMATNCHATSIP